MPPVEAVRTLSEVRHNGGRERRPAEWGAEAEGGHSQGLGEEPQDTAAGRGYLSPGHRERGYRAERLG